MKGLKQHCPISSVRPLQWCKIARTKLSLARWLGCPVAGHLSEGGLCRVFTVGNCFVVVAVVISAGICFQCWKYVWKGW